MSYAVGKAKEFSGVILPGGVPSLDVAMKLKRSAYHKEIQKLANANGIHIVSWWWTPGAFATKTSPVGGPDTVKGQKLRAADPTFESMLKAAGASTSAMASTEIYPALQSGVLTAALTSADTFVSGRLYEQTKHATVGGANSLWMLLQPLVMSKQHWDKLSPKQQKIFEEAADKADAFFLTVQREATNAMAEAWRKSGGTPRAMTDDEYKQLMELARKTAYPEYAAISPTAKRILDALEKSKAAK